MGLLRSLPRVNGTMQKLHIFSQPRMMELKSKQNVHDNNFKLKDNYTYINADGESLYILTGIMSA